MGQQQTVAGNALRRIILALVVAALMAVMMVTLAPSAFAIGGSNYGGNGNGHGGGYGDSSLSQGSDTGTRHKAVFGVLCNPHNLGPCGSNY